MKSFQTKRSSVYADRSYTDYKWQKKNKQKNQKKQTTKKQGKPFYKYMEKKCEMGLE